MTYKRYQAKSSPSESLYEGNKADSNDAEFRVLTMSIWDIQEVKLRGADLWTNCPRPWYPVATAKPDSLQAKSFWVYLKKRGITSEDSSCNQNSQIDKSNRARSQKRIIEADFDIVTFWSFDSIARKRNKKEGCDSAPRTVLDALSNDTNPIQTGRLGAEIWLTYWKKCGTWK